MARQSFTREQMRQFVSTVWQQQRLLQVLHRIHLNHRSRQLAGQQLHRELIALLSAFEAQARVPVQVVADGMVQARRGVGDYASLRSRPGYLQIEKQVFADTSQLLAEVTHALAHFAARADGDVPMLGDGPVDALVLIEQMAQEGPGPVLELLGG